MQEAYQPDYRVHGAGTIWQELNRQGHRVAHCTVERLMREIGITGAVRGKK
ncbi:IS3 family transposase [Streptomyces sp. NPDC055709]